jgi:hypothetical protein
MSLINLNTDYQNPSPSEEGQAVVEYVLLLLTVTLSYSLVVAGLTKFGLASKLTGAITGNFAAAYRYGRVDAKGYTDGGPLNHPRAEDPGGGNFRIFFNTETLSDNN